MPLIGVDLGFSPFSVVGDMQCVTISVIDDSTQEMTETFLVTILITYSDDMDFFIETVRIYITDDDG